MNRVDYATIQSLTLLSFGWLILCFSSSFLGDSIIRYVVLCEERLQLCHFKVPQIEEAISRMVGVETSCLAGLQLATLLIMMHN